MIFNPSIIRIYIISSIIVTVKSLKRLLEFSNLVLSYHNFQETPENMMEILSELTSFSPKLVKVSVMAHNEQDVLDLMNYTRGFKTLNPEQEYVTIPWQGREDFALDS